MQMSEIHIECFDVDDIFVLTYGILFQVVLFLWNFKFENNYS